jgi:microcompartment protein CcmL/EutN
MVKASNVQLTTAVSICPGKYIAIISGDVAAVDNSVKVGIRTAEEFLVDSFVLPKVHEDVFPAIAAACPLNQTGALGILEGFSAAAIIFAADVALKAARVSAVELRIGSGLGGKAYFMLCGDVAAVQKAVDAGKQNVMEKGLLVNAEVIPSPSKALWNAIL